MLSSRLVRSVVRLWRSLDGGVASQTISHGLPASEVVRPRSAVPEADAIPDVSQDDELRKEEPALVGDITDPVVSVVGPQLLEISGEQRPAVRKSPDVVAERIVESLSLRIDGGRVLSPLGNDLSKLTESNRHDSVSGMQTHPKKLSPLF